MAGKKKILVLKYAGGGNRGSTSGLRFNPREAPEFAEEDRNYGRDDPEGKEREDDEKRRTREKRLRRIEGLQHVSIQSKNKKRGEADDQRNDDELSELTGPSSSTGYPLDIAVGAKTGTGSVMGGPNIMTGDPMELAFSNIKKIAYADVRARSKPLTPPPVFDTGMGKKAKRPKKKGLLARRFLDSVRKLFGKKLRVEGHRNPEKTTSIMNSAKKTIQGGMKQISRAAGFWFPRMTASRFKGTKSGQAALSKNPAARGLQVARQHHAKNNPQGLPYRPQMALPGASDNRTLNHSGRGGTQQRHQKALRQPRTTGTPLGASATKQSNLSTGASALNPDPVGGSLDTLHKAELSIADVAELKILIRELRRVLRSGVFKKSGLEDEEHDGERPTPNAHRKTTSHARGPTEVDPEDDPRYWGTHPMGLLLPRRGHM